MNSSDIAYALPSMRQEAERSPGQRAGMSRKGSRERQVGVPRCSDRLPLMSETALAVSAADGRTLMVAQWGDLEAFQSSLFTARPARASVVTTTKARTPRLARA